MNTEPLEPPIPFDSTGLDSPLDSPLEALSSRVVGESGRVVDAEGEIVGVCLLATFADTDGALSLGGVKSGGTVRLRVPQSEMPRFMFLRFWRRDVLLVTLFAPSEKQLREYNASKPVEIPAVGRDGLIAGAGGAPAGVQLLMVFPNTDNALRVAGKRNGGSLTLRAPASQGDRFTYFPCWQEQNLLVRIEKITNEQATLYEKQSAFGDSDSDALGDSNSDADDPGSRRRPALVRARPRWRDG